VSDLSPEIKQSIREAYAKLSALPNFSTRRPQLEMIALAAEAFASEGIAAVEAPTGTGKSIAALLPAIPIATANERTIVISTATVSLQEQYLRDVPKLLATLGLDLRVVLAKGRQRYLCNRNLAELVGAPSASPSDYDLDPAWPRPPKDGETKILEALSDALSAGWSGDLDNAPVQIPSELRPLLTTPSAACAGKACPFASRCGYLNARREVESADIIISNHDVLLTDLGLHRTLEDGSFLPGGVLLSPPEASYYILDEAHHLGDRASERDSVEFPLSAAATTLRRGRKAIAAAYRVLGTDSIRSFTSKDAQDLALSAATKLTSLSETLLSQCADRLDRLGNVRFKRGVVPEALQETIEPILSDLKLLDAVVDGLTERLRASGESSTSSLAAMRAMGQFQDRLTPMLRWAKDWGEETLYRPEIPVARWLNRSDRGDLVLSSRSCEGRAMLERVLWGTCKGIVLMSATLAVGDDVGHFARSVGLPSSATVSLLSSPFDLPNQGLLRIPTVPTLPNDPGHPKTIAACLEDARDPGGVLVLFTSRAKLRATLDAIAPGLRHRVLAQGDMPIAALLANHRERIAAGHQSVIFGLQSFGEGLDLAGDLCSKVIVTGLPFAPPDDPVLATLSEFIELDGGDAFNEVTIPRVILMLTQWCGRLIRSSTDHGEIVVLDNRLKTKRYGRRILDSLPPFQRDDH
jgi:ATP-dependent DNA helicase DinG